MEKRMFRSMRTSAILLVLVLITTCIVGSTFAKFVTSSGGGDMARVAKFGVVIKANGTTFAESYDSENGPARATVKSVLSLDDNVIAPGTSGEMVSMSISGRPEVSIEVNYSAELEIVNWEVYNNLQEKQYYCPLIITVAGQDICGAQFNSADEFKNAVIKAINECSGRYDVENFGDDIKNVITVPEVTWKWEFEGQYTNNEYDTYLGNIACGGDANYTATINLAITTTVSQID